MIVDDQGQGTIVNDDVAGVSIVESGADTAVSENGTTDSIDIQLTSRPDANVEIMLSVGDQLQLDKNSLIFTPENWDDVQSVMVTAVDDANLEGGHYSAIACLVSSQDANYSNLIFPDIAVSIEDNDVVYVYLPFLVNQ